MDRSKNVKSVVCFIVGIVYPLILFSKRKGDAVYLSLLLDERELRDAELPEDLLLLFERTVPDD